jgi:hypothetical protein
VLDAPARLLEGTELVERDDHDALLVGVDGGATEVKAHAITALGDRLEAGEARAGFRYERVSGFEPLALADQLIESGRDSVRCSALEERQGELWIEAFAQAIESVAARACRARVRVGVCAPGIKSRDGRGIVAARNGPRIAGFADRLEARIVRAGLVLAGPLPPLVGDGFACGLGEKASLLGGLHDVTSAYYVGGGTGVAECFLLEGRVVSMDDVADISRKAWEMPSSLGRDFEAHLSARGLNARCVELGGSAGVLPEDGAVSGDRAALQALAECASMLAELVEKRVGEIRRARGVALERVVVGQRLGALLADPRLRASLREPAERASVLPIRASTLRAAPAIGAARWALDQRAEGRAHAV